MGQRGRRGSLDGTVWRPSNRIADDAVPAWDNPTVVADNQATDRMGSLALLRANRPFRLLWTARTVSFLGDSLSLVALMLYVAGTTGAALAVALLLLAGDFAPALLGPLTGTVSDRSTSSWS